MLDPAVPAGRLGPTGTGRTRCGPRRTALDRRRRQALLPRSARIAPEIEEDRETSPAWAQMASPEWYGLLVSLVGSIEPTRPATGASKTRTLALSLLVGTVSPTTFARRRSSNRLPRCRHPIRLADVGCVYGIGFLYEAIAES